MKKSHCALFILLNVCFYAFSQQQTWNFSEETWLEYNSINNPVEVDALRLLADEMHIMRITPAQNTFYTPEIGLINFSRGLLFEQPATTQPESSIQPVAGSISFDVTGPGSIYLLGISATPEPKRMKITNMEGFEVDISLPGMHYKNEYGSDLYVADIRYDQDASQLFIFPEDSLVALYYIEFYNADSILPPPQDDYISLQVQVPTLTNECWVAGTFNNWNYNAHQMERNEDNTYSITIPVTESEGIEYLYYSGPGPQYVETDFTGKSKINREYDEYARLDTVWGWNEVYEANPVDFTTYTVQVSENTKQVSIAGDFNNWSPGQYWMEQIDAITFQTTIQGASKEMKYNYFSGPEWSSKELDSEGVEVQGRFWHAIDTVFRWPNVEIPEQALKIFYEGLNATTGEDLVLPIKLFSGDQVDAIAFQFEFYYDSDVLEYVEYVTEGTVANMGELAVNSIPGEGILYVSFMTTMPVRFVDVSELIKLRFNVVNHSNQTTTDASFGACYIDDQEVLEKETALIQIDQDVFFILGDVDGNERIQAYDAALTLQYSVGMNPLPEIDSLPWENWRISAADVDGVDGISANDAAMILQYSAYMIDAFAAESKEPDMLRVPQQNSTANVTVDFDKNNLVFRSQGSVLGFNLFVEDEMDAFGVPVISELVTMSAVNIMEGKYAIGLATLSPLPDGTPFMTIPLLKEISSETTLKVVVNSEEKEIKTNIQSALYSLDKTEIILYPNPVKEFLYLKNLSPDTHVQIMDVRGRILVNKEAVSSSIRMDVSSFSAGLYTICVSNENVYAVSKFIKQ